MDDGGFKQLDFNIYLPHASCKPSKKLLYLAMIYIFDLWTSEDIADIVRVKYCMKLCETWNLAC